VPGADVGRPVFGRREQRRRPVGRHLDPVVGDIELKDRVHVTVPQRQQGGGLSRVALAAVLVQHRHNISVGVDERGESPAGPVRGTGSGFRCRVLSVAGAYQFQRGPAEGVVDVFGSIRADMQFGFQSGLAQLDGRDSPPGSGLLGPVHEHRRAHVVREQQ
jgi:hypothetical protein